MIGVLSSRLQKSNGLAMTWVSMMRLRDRAYVPGLAAFRREFTTARRRATFTHGQISDARFWA